ncbi:MAG: glycosyltransferase [Deltaproteobacteria bacterium]|nr:glycosyltransferase [Deltaproteobacteria bacterium]
MKERFKRFVQSLRNIFSKPSKKEDIFELDDEAKEKVKDIGEADILVGIPSYNNERTIAQVVKAVEYGLAKYFPRFKSVLLNSDGGSTDRTREIVGEISIYSQLDTILIEHPVHPACQVVTAYHGLPGKGSALQAILKVAHALGAKACMLVDADLRSITPEWVEYLLGPILIKGYDYVTPIYSRHKYDGTITNMIVYPLTRALYGKRVRQPIGGDFGLSRRLTEHYLKRGIWGTDVARYGIDIWMTTVAINEGFKVCQSYLGAKIHDPKDPAKSLEPMFKQVVGTVFELMERYEARWKTIDRSLPTAIYGFRSEVFPEPVNVSLESLIEKFKDGFKRHKDYLSKVLMSETFEGIAKVASLEINQFNFPIDLWVKTIYDFAISYHKGEERERLLEALAPIYFGRTASFIIETKDVPTYDAECLIERQCERFEALKPYLLERW